jgi:hypothetical protein
MVETVSIFRQKDLAAATRLAADICKCHGWPLSSITSEVIAKLADGLADFRNERQETIASSKAEFAAARAEMRASRARVEAALEAAEAFAAARKKLDAALAALRRDPKAG